MSRRSLLGSGAGLAIVLAVVLLVSTIGSSGDASGGGSGAVAGGASGGNTPPTVHVHPTAVLPKKVVQVALPNGTIDPNKIDLSGTPGVTPAQAARAASLLKRTILTITKWDDVNVAIKDGFHSIGDGITGDEHFLHWDWINDNDYLDPARPEALVYHVDRSTGQRTLEAAMFIMPQRFQFSNLATFNTDHLGGPLTQFHIHDNLCFTNDPVAPRVLGLTDANGNCSPPLVKFHPNAMVHVWIRNNPCGPFAALEGVGAGQTAPGTTRNCDEHNSNEATLSSPRQPNVCDEPVATTGS